MTRVFYRFIVNLQSFILYVLRWRWLAEKLEIIMTRQAWHDGFDAACEELSKGRCFMLTAGERTMNSNSPWRRPKLYVYCPNTVDNWDAGYHWAILMWRIGNDPRVMKSTSSLFAKYNPLFSMIGFVELSILDGDLRVDPRLYVSPITGDALADRNNEQRRLDQAYASYAETVHQLKNTPPKYL
jgi:hypothetical protein